MSVRLSLARDAGAFDAASLKRVALIGVPGDFDVSEFGAAELKVVQPLMPDAAQWERRGVRVTPELGSDKVDVSLVILPRAKADARARIADAMAVTEGVVLIDGAKTDGVDSLLKEMRKRTDIRGVISKAHGKLFWVAPSDVVSEWTAQPSVIDGRWHVRPGVFSADGIDPGSAALSAALPDRVGGHVADLGAGWGYLAGTILERDAKIKSLHLVEAHAGALDAARRNVEDARAVFHWADATTWSPPHPLDAVIMNPPFHTGRAAEPDLGRAFIAAAHRCLRPGGTLWMVANRHLPYERALHDQFGEMSEIGGDAKFKILQARRGR